ncbi:hypothetical protein PPSIR1_41204 [Plesiocystis pacifica SIR-1]|uniref:Uncharacterized protein n=1 Tax=Plesiocystis pacifica SIR-1 TaxID=391625 RepID=A6GFR8_9BACT|nr:hypothetical protein [Plesiocystis pacifica]EDM75265.1 hypothetical protein PPSIR1_41204 [Plesiocystis pacifica SIR-1]
MTLTAALALGACGDDGERGETFGDELGMSADESGAATGTAEDETGDSGSETETSAGESETTETTETESSGTEASADSEDSDTDTETDSETGDPCAPDGYPLVDRFIWIANSAEGTVSKINTEGGAELGRYIVRPDGGGSPSRTSVNRRGDVVVASRTGGVTAIHADVDDCVESNGIPGIQTSMGEGEILDWGTEECVAWHRPIPHPDNRPVAWTNGVFNEQTCDWEDLDVWTAWSDVLLGTAVVALLDGETGEIIQEVPIPDLPEAWPNWFGFYGAAVDSEDNVWLSQLQHGWLVKVRRDTFAYTGYPVPGPTGGYGMTVTDGYVWLCGRSTHRFNPGNATWISVEHFLETDPVHTGGCMGDGEGKLWRGAYNQLFAVDTDSLEVVEQIDVTQEGDNDIWGVAVDFDGFVWAVPRSGTRAYKVSPDADIVVQTVDGLVGAYTYSDMTGFALQNVGN